MKVLVTGFDPFGEDKINPALEAIRKLDKIIGDKVVVVQEVPTVFKKSIDVVVKAIEQEKPDFVVCVGQAGGRFEVTVERVAINIDDARIKDNEGNQPVDEPIDPDGPAAYFSTLPIKDMVRRIKENHIPASVSNTAGTFVCNHLFYGVMNYIHKNKLPIKAGFIHIPYLPEQVIEKNNTPYMSLDMILIALKAAISAL